MNEELKPTSIRYPPCLKWNHQQPSRRFRSSMV